ncbi:hypothetical protein ACFOW1_15880 [Parasediminibacterium paludis]|uniref:Uncharacterized protein n=1 Tax=Parasediminibacterium paludis TaxID=908966 RepID=A0ABV8Q2J6_9BACT
MQKEILISLSKNYSDILPQNEESLLLLVCLFKKIEDGYLDEDFEQKDLDDTIEEVAEFLQKGTAIQKETLLKKLSSHFCHTHAVGNKYLIHLTVFAKEMCRLLIDQVEPELKKFELYFALHKTLPLDEEDLLNIDNFSYWFKNNFLPAQKTILRNTELLQTAIEGKIVELRNLLKPEVENPNELINSFTKIFKELEIQTLGLINTLDYKNETLNKIKALKQEFSQDEETFTEFDKMQREIDWFFQSIDRRIYSINDKIQLASKRLKNLFDTLKHKQLFKIKIEKFLTLLLKTSRNEKGEILLHDSIEKKLIPFIPMKFIAIPKIDFKYLSTAEPQKQTYDKSHEQEERKKGLALLKIQESTSQWLDKINTEMESGSEINFEDWFDKILESENNLEVPINVCFGLIEQHNKKENQVITIDKVGILKVKNELSLWKMKIQTTYS